MLPRVISLLISALIGAFTGLLIAGASAAFAATTTHIDLPVAKSYALACGGAGGAFAPVTSPRAPGLCLPNPCAAQLGRAQFGALILGRPADDAAWDSYASRYAEVCRAEAVVPSTVPRASTTTTFWEPLVSLGDTTSWPALTPLAAQDAGNVTAFYAGAGEEGTWEGPQKASRQGLARDASTASGGSGRFAPTPANGFALTSAQGAFVFDSARASRSSAAGIAAPRGIQLVAGQAGAVVPLPAPFWLLLTGLLALRYAGTAAKPLLRRRRSAPIPTSAPINNRPVAGSGTVGTTGPGFTILYPIDRMVKLSFRPSAPIPKNDPRIGVVKVKTCCDAPAAIV
jgi:hypothetical protein